MKSIKFIIVLVVLSFVSIVSPQANLTYKIVDTGQVKCYNNNQEISTPNQGSAFYGQDAQFDGFQPSYTDNGDGLLLPIMLLG